MKSPIPGVSRTQEPGVVIDLHVNDEVAGIQLSLSDLFLPALELGDLFRRHDHLAEEEVQPGDVDSPQKPFADRFLPVALHLEMCQSILSDFGSPGFVSSAGSGSATSAGIGWVSAGIGSVAAGSSVFGSSAFGSWVAACPADSGSATGSGVGWLASACCKRAAKGESSPGSAAGPDSLRDGGPGAARRGGRSGCPPGIWDRRSRITGWTLGRRRLIGGGLCNGGCRRPVGALRRRFRSPLLVG